MRIHHTSFLVRRYECDPKGRLMLGQLLRFFQESAAQHSTDLGVSQQKLAGENLAWMLYRLRVEITRWPKAEEAISLETWPSGFLRTLATREFRIASASGETLVEASSAWLMANTKLRKVAIIPEWVTLQAASEAEPLLDISSRRVAKSKAPTEPVHEFIVRRSDVDSLKHVNNVRYVEWILETIPDRLWDDQELATLDVLFRKEGLLDDKVRVETACEQQICHHRIIHAERKEEMVQAHSTWRR
jgi:medium-chain acyl-[acyl-carrier-protein] hydrolase